MRSRKHKPLVPSYLGPFALEIYRRGDFYLTRHSFAFLQATIIIVCAAEVLSLSCYDIDFESCVFVLFPVLSYTRPRMAVCVKLQLMDWIWYSPISWGWWSLQFEAVQTIPFTSINLRMLLLYSDLRITSLFIVLKGELPSMYCWQRNFCDVIGLDEFIYLLILTLILYINTYIFLRLIRALPRESHSLEIRSKKK